MAANLVYPTYATLLAMPRRRILLLLVICFARQLGAGRGSAAAGGAASPRRPTLSSQGASCYPPDLSRKENTVIMAGSTPEHDDTSTHDVVREADAAAPSVPAGLYERARRYLLENEPLRARSSEGTSIPEALSAPEIDALRSVGLSTERWRRAGRTDPLAQSIADYMALLDTSLTTSQAAKYLKVDPSRIRQRLRERSLYGIEYDGEKRLPRFQFERRRVIPGLAEVLAELPVPLNPLDVAEWFLSPNPDLELPDRLAPISPREWLLSGRAVQEVVALARGFE